MKPNWISIGAFLGGLAVISGAFGAHGLKERLAPEALEQWKTAALYHVLHAAALVLYGLFDREHKASWIGWCFFSGLVIFSGSVYALALGSPRWFGAITPIGGLAMILGWFAFAWRARSP